MPDDPNLSGENAPLLDLGLNQLQGARVSPCGDYRYDLWREWNTQPKLAFIMLNPSTADAHKDDPTIRRCVGFAKRDGYGGIVVRNLFAYRTPSPRVLAYAHAGGAIDVVGPENDYWLQRLVGDLLVGTVGGVVAAWGAGTGIPKRLFNPRQMAVKDQFNGLLSGFLPPGEKAGPRHPLYLRGDTPIVPFLVPLNASSGSARR